MSNTNIGYEMTIQNKRTLECLQVYWDEGYPILTVMYQQTIPTVTRAVKAFAYPSYAEVQQAVEDFKARCAQQGCASMQSQRSGHMSKSLVQQWYGDDTPDAPIDILSLFTPPGQKTSADITNAQTFAGAKTIPCDKIQLYKNVGDFVILLADHAKYRIFNPFEWKKQFLWTYGSDDEMKVAFENFKQQYLADGYELVLEEAVDYPFDASLKISQE